MKNTNTIVIISSVLVVAAIAGITLTFSPKIAGTSSAPVNVDLTRAELELATINDNLDSIFLSIKKLESAGEATKEELAVLKDVSAQLKAQGSTVSQSTDGWSSFEKNSKKQSVALARAELELANIKQDFDSIFIATKKLESLGETDNEELEELAKVTKAVALYSELERAKADHNHEAVVHLADQILLLYPTHAKTRQSLKESGLIFYHLTEGLENMRKAFVELEEDSSIEELKVTLDKQARMLELASEHFASATKLDPFFVDSLEVNKNIYSYRTFKGESIATDLLSQWEDLLRTADKIGAKSYDTVNELIDNEVSLKRAYGAIEKPLKDSRESLLEVYSKLRLFVNLTDDLRTKDNSAILDLAKSSILSLQSDIDKLMNPKGTMRQWSDDIDKVRASYRNRVNQFAGAQGNTEKNTETLLNAVKAINTFKVFKDQGKTQKILKNREEIIREL